MEKLKKAILIFILVLALVGVVALGLSKYNEKTVSGKVQSTNETEENIVGTIDLDKPEYEEKVNLHFYQRKDMGINQIINKDESEFDINVYTFGGDSGIIVDGDMVYTLEDALKQNVITIDDILNQAEMDRKFGVCEVGTYIDGGSIEYMYPDYTILKYDNLDGKKDLVIGFSGEIMNKFEEELKKQKSEEN